ncbi:probable serine/threonine-protein kinase DDB_G0272282 [Gigantopelta aegis]|uniref:probable serine/threonine-protein kinase DDB_G0272282 n=1 Tax=Gigantopelta aegis TaxID=1735272 RepID=UPI001B889F1A|nr:probable serine/threonine-protein kinase DDB_G0272282 [Gigantopelta aegis]
MKIVNAKGLTLYASSGSPPDKEGHLMKRGELNKSFQRRWFVLRGNLLFYYEKKGDREPIGVIVMEGCTIELAENTDNFTFQINFASTGYRTYFLSANTQETMESWMKSLSAAGYEYTQLLVADLQQRSLEASAEQQRKVVEEADRQSRLLAQNYTDSQMLKDTASNAQVTRRTNPFNSRKSSGSEYDAPNLFNAMELGEPEPYVKSHSQAVLRDSINSNNDQTGMSTFLKMHNEVAKQIELWTAEWKHKQLSMSSVA